MSGGKSFAEFAETISFVKGVQTQQVTSSKNEETRSVVPSFLIKLTGYQESSGNSQQESIPSTIGQQLYPGNPPGTNNNDNPIGSFATTGFNYAKKSFNSVRTGAYSTVARTQERVEEAQTAASRYLYFSLCVIAGGILILLSFIFLPLVVLAPQKFALLFTMGSIFLINGLGLLKGYVPLFHHLIDKQRVIFSAGYFLFLGLTLYATLGLRSYILTLLSALLQLFFLVTLLVSNITGGTRIIFVLKTFGLNALKRLFGYGESTILPL